jgi:hypothetical protein
MSVTAIAACTQRRPVHADAGGEPGTWIVALPWLRCGGEDFALPHRRRVGGARACVHRRRPGSSDEARGAAVDLGGQQASVDHWAQ